MTEITVTRALFATAVLAGCTGHVSQLSVDPETRLVVGLVDNGRSIIVYDQLEAERIQLPHGSRAYVASSLDGRPAVVVEGGRLLIRTNEKTWTDATSSLPDLGGLRWLGTTGSGPAALFKKPGTALHCPWRAGWPDCSYAATLEGGVLTERIFAVYHLEVERKYGVLGIVNEGGTVTWVDMNTTRTLIRVHADGDTVVARTLGDPGAFFVVNSDAALERVDTSGCGGYRWAFSTQTGDYLLFGVTAQLLTAGTCSQVPLEVTNPTAMLRSPDGSILWTDRRDRLHVLEATRLKDLGGVGE